MTKGFKDADKKFHPTEHKKKRVLGKSESSDPSDTHSSALEEFAESRKNSFEKLNACPMDGCKGKMRMITPSNDKRGHHYECDSCSWEDLVIPDKPTNRNAYRSPGQLKKELQEDEWKTSLTEKQKEILEKLEDDSSVLTEDDVNYIKDTINHSFAGQYGKPATRLDEELIDMTFNNEEHFKLTSEQNEKGKKWLMKFYNKKLGNREQKVMDDFKEIRLSGFYDVSNAGSSHKFYVPGYTVYAKDGNSFDYHIASGGLEILG